MDNKLSELSKPVATVDVQRGRQDGNMFAVAWSAAGHALPDGPHFIYSQEYVSALLARIAELEQVPTIKHMRAVESALISATDRASEWERKAFSNFEDCASMSQRIAELELRLAVEIEPPPVIYPGRYDCHAMHSAIRRAGFRVSGDSEHVGDVDMRDERALAAVSDKQRIAELEAIATDYAGKFQKAQDAAKHLVIMNDSAQAEIAHLKALLATPVRLPRRAPENLASVLDGYEKWLIATTFRDTWNACLDEVSRASSGFTVEGDE